MCGGKTVKVLNSLFLFFGKTICASTKKVIIFGLLLWFFFGGESKGGSNVGMSSQLFVFLGFSKLWVSS